MTSCLSRSLPLVCFFLFFICINLRGNVKTQFYYAIFYCFQPERFGSLLCQYVNKLGFEVWYTGPDDDPYWAMVGRGPVSIMLKAITADVKPVPNHTRHEWASWDAYISVEDPDALPLLVEV